MWSYSFTKEAALLINYKIQDIAKATKSNQTLPEHILLGLFMIPDCTGLKVINKLSNNNAYKMKTNIEKGLNAIKSTDSKIFGKIPDSTRVSQVLTRAAIIAKEFNDKNISVNYLILAILCEDDSLALSSLKSINIDYDTYYDEIYQQNDTNGAELETVAANNRSGRKENNINPNSKTPYLDKYTIDLTKEAKNGKIDKYVGRDDEILRMVQIISRRKKNNPIILGEPGVGKTALVEGLALAIINDTVPNNVKNKRVLALDLTLCVAGTKFRGEFEERMKNIVIELEKTKNSIIFIDEIHTMIGAGNMEGNLDAANILKPALARGKIQCIGATTLNEYKTSIEKDGALARRFQSINIDEPSIDETVEILNGIKAQYEDYHKVTYTDNAITAAAKLSKRFITDRFLPDKAIDLIDEAGAKIRIENFKEPKEIQKIKNEIKKIEKKQHDLVNKGEFEKAIPFRDKKKDMQEELAEKTKKWVEDSNKNRILIEEDDIKNVVSFITKIPLHKLDPENNKRFVNIESELSEKVVGQEDAVKAISKSIRRNVVGLKRDKKPIGSFLFLGPTGVGKTSLAKALADFMFGNEEAMLRIDMSEYMEKFSISRLIGAPPGYVGYEEGGVLTEKVKRKPYSLILFDEIEKAHRDVANILLQILDEGTLTDSFGNKINFSNTVIIITSNLGAKEMNSKNGLGFGAREEEAVNSKIKETALEELKLYFNPEFLNRLDDIIVFDSLNNDCLKSIIDMMVVEINDMLKEKHISIELTDKAKKYLIDKGFDKKYGARSLRRFIQKEIEDELSIEILNEHIDINDHILIDSDEEKLLFNYKEYVNQIDNNTNNY